MSYPQRVRKEKPARQLSFEQKDDKRLAKLNTSKTRFLPISPISSAKLTFAPITLPSSGQLRRKLKALTNQTVTEYVRNYRLEKAAELLKNKAGTVSEIACQVGFESLSYFSKVFQDKFGKTASEWH